MSSLSKSMIGQMPGRGLVNPAFVIKILPATDDMQQQPSSGRENPNNDYMDNVEAGNTAQAKVDGKTVTGTIKRVIKNGLGDVTYVILLDKNGKERKIEATQISIVRAPSMDVSRARELTSSPAHFTEQRFSTYDQYTTINE